MERLSRPIQQLDTIKGFGKNLKIYDLKINELLIINKEMGRPRIYHTEEERLEAIRRNHTKLVRETKWYCEVCQREYSLGSKTNHLNTAKHFRNFYKDKPLVEI